MKNLIFSLLIFTGGCGVVSKPETTDPNIKTVQLHATVHKPYCGGAKPSPDVAAGYYESMKLEKFNILKGTSFKEGMAVYKEIQLDEGGNISMQLEKGDYMIMRADKSLSLEDFIKENSHIENENYKLKDNDCFKKWKTTVDMYFKVESDTVIELRQKAKCWVGTNPCLEYVGPPAP